MALTGIPQIPTTQLRGVFTASGSVSVGTVTSPQVVFVVAVGGGGGGGSTALQNTIGNRNGHSGGGGGAAGAVTFGTILLNGTVNYTVGAGGAGALAQTVNNNPGITGTAGGSSTFSTISGGAGTGGRRRSLGRVAHGRLGNAYGEPRLGHGGGSGRPDRTGFLAKRCGKAPAALGFWRAGQPWCSRRDIDRSAGARSGWRASQCLPAVF